MAYQRIKHSLGAGIFPVMDTALGRLSGRGIRASWSGSGATRTATLQGIFMGSVVTGSVVTGSIVAGPDDVKVTLLPEPVNPVLWSQLVGELTKAIAAGGGRETKIAGSAGPAPQPSAARRALNALFGPQVSTARKVVTGVVLGGALLGGAALFRRA